LKHKLVYTKRAAKDIKRLEGATKNRIGETLLRYAQDPLKYAEKLIDPSLGTYRFRIGEYRVIFDLEESDIVILRAGHRRDIYRRF